MHLDPPDTTDPVQDVTALTVDSRLVDAVARRVLELLSDENPGGGVQLLTVAQVARRFQVHPNWCTPMQGASARSAWVTGRKLPYASTPLALPERSSTRHRRKRRMLLLGVTARLDGCPPPGKVVCSPSRMPERRCQLPIATREDPVRNVGRRPTGEIKKNWRKRD